MEKSRIESPDSFVSPYLREPLRSLEEVLRERQAKQMPVPDNVRESPSLTTVGSD